MAKKEKLYFATHDDEICYPLGYHISKAKEEGLKEISLYEAEKDKGNPFIFCGLFTDEIPYIDCNKKCEGFVCNKEGRICNYRGHIRKRGELKTFSIE